MGDDVEQDELGAVPVSNPEAADEPFVVVSPAALRAGEPAPAPSAPPSDPVPAAAEPATDNPPPRRASRSDMVKEGVSVGIQRASLLGKNASEKFKETAKEDRK
eukprot:3453538-Prymnesium_polylepis.1